MRYKTLVSKKLEALDNNVSGLNSLLSQNFTREQFLRIIDNIREKIEEIQTLVNSEQESN